MSDIWLTFFGCSTLDMRTILERSDYDAIKSDWDAIANDFIMKGGE